MAREKEKLILKSQPSCLTTTLKGCNILRIEDFLQKFTGLKSLGITMIPTNILRN